MASSTDQSQSLHVFFFPFMSPGHLIPMTDMARIFAVHGAKSTIITTPQNICRIKPTLIKQSNNINLLTIDFPFSDADLPPNCENLDTLPSRHLSCNFSKATMLMQPQADDLVCQHEPDAIISDQNLPWTAEIARKYNIPRLVFHGTCCFSLCLSVAASQCKAHVDVSSDTEHFLVPGLPDPIVITKAQMPDRFFANLGLNEFFQKFKEAEEYTYGVVANTFREIEPEYVKQYEKISQKRVYPVGPVLLCNNGEGEAIDIALAERGNRASIDRDKCLTWLDSKEPNSVLYVCFGSLCEFAGSQILEIGLGLEASNKSFIWAIKHKANAGILDSDYEERVKDRGLLIKGWAPQVLILNHPAVGGFMTHCGWNSVLESVCSGVPLITWPLFAEQFYNENFVLNRLRIGLGIGVESGLAWGEEEKVGVLVKRERVEEVVTRLMSSGGDDEEVDEMRKRASELKELAELAMSEGGSSSVNVSLLIRDLLNKKTDKIYEDITDNFV